MQIWAHCLVKNEERYLWYAVTSVIDFVDKVLLWDTGSTDSTLKIINEIQKRYPSKIDFKEIGEVTPEGYTKARQEMLSQTRADWTFVLDGDEIWWDGSVKKIIETIDSENIDVVVSPYINLIGDPYHYQEERAGRYTIDKMVGNITIRAFSRKIPGLHLEKSYGLEGYFDATGQTIQESSVVKREFVNAPFLHFTHLRRSEKDKEVMGREGKTKYELGIPFPLDFYYPEVFFKPRSPLVFPPWERTGPAFTARAIMEHPFRKIKRFLHG